MLSRRTIRRPSKGAFQIAVRTVFPCHSMSRGRPTFTESRRGIACVSDLSSRLSSHVSNFVHPGLSPCGDRLQAVWPWGPAFAGTTILDRHQNFHTVSTQIGTFARSVAL